MNIPKYTTESFIKACKNNPILQNPDGTPKYDYSETIYNSKEVEIICHVKDENGIEHGKFKKRPSAHLNQGQGCRKCQYQNRKITQEKFIQKCKEKYPQYDYSITKYIGMNYDVEYICPIHGKRKQRADVIYYGHGGCNDCGNMRMSKKLTYTPEEFIQEAKLIHDSIRDKIGLPRYGYSNTKYIGIYDNIDVFCPIHNKSFTVKAEYHLHNKSGCPWCSNNGSNSEKELFKFIYDNLPNINILHNTRSIISPKELDIYIPEHKLAIEFDGTYWHSELYKSNDYHLQKTIDCEKQDIQLIHIFEDEWLEKRSIVESRILNLLGKNKFKIGARKCKIKQVPIFEEKEFLKNHHLQGYVASTICYGLYYYNKPNNKEYLVALMSFGPLRISTGNKLKEGYYELYRFVTAKNFSIPGGASRLFKHFIKVFNPKQIISFADRRWSIHLEKDSQVHSTKLNLYEQLGFKLKSISKPNYFYVDKSISKRHSRFKFTKHKLKELGCTDTMTEHEFMNSIGYFQLYDCGQLVYEYINI